MDTTSSLVADNALGGYDVKPVQSLESADQDRDQDTLDPNEWADVRALGHRMLDDLFDGLSEIREGPVWRPMPPAARGSWNQPLPRGGSSPEAVYADFRRLIEPYAVGNRHPLFLGWVHGAGTAAGALAEMLAGGLDANCGGRDHVGIVCERQIIAWAAAMLGLPRGSSGLLLTGTSMSNLVGVLVARCKALGPQARRTGLGGARLTGYASAAVHLCVARAFDMVGLGSDALRLIPCDESMAISLPHLRERIAEDRAAGYTPFLVVGTGGTVDTGGIDDLAGLAEICAAEALWFHVDAAFGAIAMLSPKLRPLFAGVERADSVAFDFHKWAHVPYDAGCIVVRDPEAHRAAFTRDTAYLRRTARGLAAGDPWPVDLGPELSRGFRALKVWMTLKTYGTDRIGRVTERCCAWAQRLAAAVDAEPRLECVAPVSLNIVCFRHTEGGDDLQAAIAADLQEAGQVVLSTTVIDGRTVLRAAFVNHRTRRADVDGIVPAVLDAAARRLRRASSRPREENLGK